jgi:hypothetical protein
MSRDQLTLRHHDHPHYATLMMIRASVADAERFYEGGRTMVPSVVVGSVGCFYALFQ